MPPSVAFSERVADIIVRLFVRNKERASFSFWVLSAFLTLTFLVGGGARSDVQSLALLRPAAVLACGVGLWTLRAHMIAHYRVLFWLAAGILAMPLLHLVPLPPSLWQALPGHGIVTDIDRLAGVGQVWRPLSIAPVETGNAFFSLFVPLAVLLLGVQLSREERYRILPLLVGLGLLSGLIGLFQVVGDPQGMLYFYRITNNGSAVGLFSNRNHAAIYLACLLPMLAIYASSGLQSVEQARFRGWAAVISGAVLIPLLLVTGSRAGLVVGVLGLAAAAVLYRKPVVEQPARRRTVRINPAYLLISFGGVALALMTALFSRAEAFKRLLAPDQLDDLRFRMWGPIAGMGWKYFPFGSGMGSFVEAFQIDEPADLLSGSYANHAHNDWLELYLTGGVLALLLIVVTVFAWARRSWAVWTADKPQRREIAFARLGSILLFLLALASVGDYPLRVPSLMCFAVISAIWLHIPPPDQAGSGRTSREKKMEVSESLS